MNENIAYIKKLLNKINAEEHSGTGFVLDKTSIEKIFSLTKNCEQEDILARLTVVDSMYSTQMNRRYYGLQELAEAICLVSSKQNRAIEELFISFTKNQDSSLFDYEKIEGGKTISTNLFSEKYGIGKDGKDKGIAISLISKYAYFATGKQFPIFDSIACEMFPLIWKYCGFKETAPKLIIYVKGKQDVLPKETMEAYVAAINTLCGKLGKDASYDLVDRVLWFVGKIIRGNLSLVLSREQYIRSVNAPYDKYWCSKDKSFCIQKVEKISNLKFIEKDSVLYDFFDLAKQLSTSRK